MALAVVLMVLAILGTVRAGGRLYRGAVLHTGGRLCIRQAWHQAPRVSQRTAQGRVT